MNHYLIIGFCCQTYKENPLIRIYVNDTFVDELELNDSGLDIEKNYSSIKSKNLLSNKRLYSDSKQISRIYELHGREDIDISIYVENNDNNFCNGFMTKWTKTVLNYIFVIPKKIFKDYVSFYDRYSFSKNSIKKNPEEIKKYYTLKKDTAFGNYTEYTSWKSKSLDLDGVYPYFTLGESGKYTLKLKKKFGVLIPLKLRKGKLKIIHPYDLQFILNKYSYHEN